MIPVSMIVPGCKCAPRDAVSAGRVRGSADKVPPETEGGVAMAGDGMASVNHVVVPMLENRSFDHMLGFLYTSAGNVSPSGQPYDGLAGTGSNPGSSGQPVTVSGIEPTTASACFMPGADPGEGYMATNDQLYGSDSGPASASQAATCQGFVKDYASALKWETADGWPIVSGTVERHHGLLHLAGASRAVGAGQGLCGL
jgi:phospholipase C